MCWIYIFVENRQIGSFLPKIAKLAIFRQKTPNWCFSPKIAKLAIFSGNCQKFLNIATYDKAEAPSTPNPRANRYRHSSYVRCAKSVNTPPEQRAMIALSHSPSQ